MKKRSVIISIFWVIAIHQNYVLSSTSTELCYASHTSFECIQNGKFPVPNDTSCKSYYFCYQLQSGNFSQTIYSCSSGFFNPVDQSCENDFVCPCSKENKNNIDISKECNKDASFECSGNGRFKDPTDFTCKNYYYCYKLKSGIFSKRSYSCSLGYFNQNTKSCDLNYTCSCSTETTSISTVNTTPVETTTAVTDSSAACSASIEAIFECTDKGRFTDPTDFSCKNYYYCYKLNNGTFAKKLYSCSLGNFNQDTQSCDLNHTCLCSTETTSSPTGNTTLVEITTAVTKSLAECDASQDKIFKCIDNGRFKDPTDFTCKNYYYCYKLKNGTFTQKLYSCSLGYFNQDTQSCDLDYTCSCFLETTSNPTVDTTLAEAIATTTKSSAACGAPIEAIFKCTDNGRYTDPTDFTCKNYYYCYKLKNGTFAKKIYSCSLGIFNQDTQSCDLNHTCLCSTETTSSPTGNTTLVEITTAVTKSLAECDASEDKIFKCIDNGRFKDPTDFTCKNYYYCYKLKNGTFTQKLYSCSLGYFNQDTQSCDLDYTCSCFLETTSNPTVDTTLAEAIATTTKSSAACGAPIEAIFKCTDNGRYTDPTDFTCKNYYYCYKLKNGTFAKKIYSCSLGIFNQDTQSCDLNHTCLCSTETTSSPTGNTTLVEITTAVTESSAECDASKDKIFKCVDNGRFKDPTDFTCKNYYYCYKLKNGTFTQKLYSCSLGYFNQDTQSCDLDYTCSCFTETTSNPNVDTTLAEATTTTTKSSKECDASTEAFFKCIDSGRFKDPTDFTCKNYYYCYKLKNGTFAQRLYSCSLGNFNQDTQSCDLNHTCLCSTETTSSPTVYTTPDEVTTAVSESLAECDASKHKIFSCINNGRFKDPTDFTCTNYYYCYKLKNGTFIQKLYSCSLGYFNQDNQSCDLDYTCPCLPETTRNPTINETTTATSKSSTECDASREAIFKCIDNGRFRDPTDFTCKNYYYCYKLKNGPFTQNLYSCSLGYFNQNTGSCDLNYTCSCFPETTSNPTVNTTLHEATTRTTEPLAECNASTNTIFECTENGRFIDLTDVTCKNYYYCYKQKNGTFAKNVYSCSLGYFNPHFNSCDIDYICPCSLEPTTVKSDITDISEVTIDITTEKLDITNTDTVLTTESILESTINLITCDVSGSFICSAEGKFKNPGDLTCESFYDCIKMDSNNFTQILYTCSEGYFNPILQECKSDYLCPCASTTLIADIITTDVSTIIDISDTTVESSSDDVEVKNITELSSEVPRPTTVTFSTTTLPNGACNENSTNEIFLCSEDGRFSDPKDLTCTSYYLCYKPQGRNKFIQKRYSCCPGYFDPRIRGCVDDYLCPCSNFYNK